MPGMVTHQKNVANLFPKSGVTAVWLSSAFVNSAGVSAIEDVLSAHASVATCVVGIRNGASTFQGLTALLATGATVYVVDTGTPYRIFHPKIYAAVTKENAFVIIGSANTTYGGLYNNIEASAHITLDLSDKSDAEFLAGIIDPLTYLMKKHPANCYQLCDAKQAAQLLIDGVVENEDNPKVSGPVGIASKGAKPGRVPLISLPFKQTPKKGKPTSKTASASSTPVPTAGTLAQPVIYGQLVWEKPKLPRSDLQFPGANGNATGVIRLTQAKFMVGGSIIDQTTYFRNVVFSKLPWNTTISGKETSSFEVALVIAGVLVGTFTLPLSHNNAWESGQGNYTTAIHWDAAVTHIRHLALVGRSLSLYAPSGKTAPYVIEID